MKVVKLFALLLVVAAAFGVGYVVRAARGTTPGAAAASRILYYVDPMHPAYKSDKPGIAPDCGMKLEPVYADDPGVATATTGEGEGTAVPPNAIRIPVERQQLIGVKFAAVARESTGRTLRTVGKVAYDETRIGHVHPRIEGWVQQVHVNFTGEQVRQGDPMLTIYSPEMLASQNELLLAARARDLMQKNPLQSAAEHGDSLFEAAKRRLELWDLGPEQIEQVLRTGQPIRNITLRAPMSGFVTERTVFANQRVTPESDLYTIADLSRVWVLADVFETDIAAIGVGARARVLHPYSSAKPMVARVNYIQPEVDPVTRTLKVRLDMANPGTHLKPEMFVNVEFVFAGADRLVVPSDAVLDTGARQTVFIDRGNGYLEPRQVKVGERVGDRIVILEGLAEGDRVVSSGTFLIDSESQLKAAASGMGAPGAHRHD